MKYSGIDRCDSCGRVLEHGYWLSGLCRACEKAVNRGGRRAGTRVSDTSSLEKRLGKEEGEP